MSNEKYVIGIDYGTDSCRALIVSADNGREIATAVSRYPRWSTGKYCDPRKNMYRQHPLDYIESLEQSVREALSLAGSEIASRITAIGFDTTGSTPVLTDRRGTPLALTAGFEENPNAMFILWKDHTSVNEAVRINDLARQSSTDYTMYEGGTYSSEWVWAKVLHVIEEDRGVSEAAYSWIEHCDWMGALLTGTGQVENVMRSRCAAGHKAMWDSSWGGLPPKEFLSRLNPRLAEFRDKLYTETYTSGTPAGHLSKEWAQRLGLNENVVVGVGAIDAHLGAVGASIAPKVLTRIMGTSTCDILIIDPKTLDGKCVTGICGQADGSVVPGYVGLEAGQSAFGDIYAWFRELLSWPLKNLMSPCEDIDAVIEKIIPALSDEANKIPIAESAVIALDWMNGRRTPHANQNLKGLICGLTLGTNAPMIFKALVEATAFGSKAITDHFRKEGIEIESIHAIGGICQKSSFVMQTLSDVLDMPIRVIRSSQACALGTAMCAAVAGGLYNTVTDAQKAMGSEILREYTPIPEHTSIYNRLYDKYIKTGRFAETLSD